VTVVIPTLNAGAKLETCVGALARQTFTAFEVFVVDNSGLGLARAARLEGVRLTILDNAANAGYGPAINQAVRSTRTPFVAVLNDDARAHPEWLAAMIAAIGDAGMCACRILSPENVLESAGMLLALDGSSKQRGQGEPPSRYQAAEDVLLPSGCAALYRREMLEEIGGFDESFFLYCEDTDLGLRARWAGWRCVYAPSAVVDHDHSDTAGRASPLKAYLVERNRLRLVVKNFPFSMLAAVPFYEIARYFWHGVALARGRGLAGEFRASGNGSAARLVWIVVRAHLALLTALPALWRERLRVRARARITAGVFRRLAAEHRITLRKVAEL
jgi:GT2 family glycosyltransferase